MWMIEPNLLCRKHLLGEHGEIHKHRHNFVKHHKIDRRISPIVQIEPMSMGKRHDDLAKEMIKRGYNHNSPYIQPDISYLKKEQQEATVDIDLSYLDLSSRCPECLKNIKNKINGKRLL